MWTNESLLGLLRIDALKLNGCDDDSVKCNNMEVVTAATLIFLRSAEGRKTAEIYDRIN